MPTFKMDRLYEGTRTLKTDDLLTAVKETCNYEGDLYVDGELVLSCLGLSYEDNTESLLRHGITSYVKDGTRLYKYTDESKNIKKYFVNLYQYDWDGVNKVQFNIHDYRNGANDVEFSTLRDVFTSIRTHTEQFPYGPEDVHVIIWSDEWGCTSFSPEDWKIDEEPVRYDLFYEEGKLTHGTKRSCEERIARLLALKAKWVTDVNNFKIIRYA